MVSSDTILDLLEKQRINRSDINDLLKEVYYLSKEVSLLKKKIK